ncbi:unnamed protein product, partial [Musa textilis]
VCPWVVLLPHRRNAHRRSSPMWVGSSVRATVAGGLPAICRLQSTDGPLACSRCANVAWATTLAALPHLLCQQF